MLATLERSDSPVLVNALANDPSIRPHIGGDPKLPLDLAEAVQCERNVCLMGEHGGFLLIWTGPHCYEVHTLIRPEGRGAWALDAAKTGANIMFDAFGAKHLWTRVLITSRKVRAFTIAAGMKPCGQEVFDLGTGPEVYNLYERRE